jgi:hypothetical protein
MTERDEERDGLEEAVAESELARREMVYLLRSILEEVHNQRQAQSRPPDDDDGPRHDRLHGAALEALRLFQQMEAQIDFAGPNDITGTNGRRRRY